MVMGSTLKENRLLNSFLDGSGSCTEGDLFLMSVIIVYFNMLFFFHNAFFLFHKKSADSRESHTKANLHEVSHDSVSAVNFCLV